MSGQSQIVHEFEAGRQTIRASLSQFRGETYLDLRQWYEPEPGEDLRPSKRGICVPADCLDDLRASVDAFASALGLSAQKRQRTRRAA